MSNFIEEFKKELDEKYNISITENGAVGYKTTTHKLLDMNFKVASYRGLSESQIINDFVQASNEDFELSVAWLFYARDVREGLGERRLFKVIMKQLANGHPDLVKKLIKFIPEYGRYDDLLELLDTPVKDNVVALIAKTLSEDMVKMGKKEPISLLAKWMPSNNTSSKKTRSLAMKLQKELSVSPKQYRQMLSKLRKYLDVVETKMSNKDWKEIDYEKVPSKANLLYRNAFLKHDEARREQYLEAVKEGTAKINSSVVFPHELVHKYNQQNSWWGTCADSKLDPTLEAMWENLPNLGLEDTIVVADGSGSMFRTIGNSDTTALDVANGLALYAAERCKGEFKDTYITFSSHPQLVQLNGAKTLHDKVAVARSHDECENTNIEAVFNLILSTAINAHMKQEEMPKNILIISDMEFDSCACMGQQSWATPTKSLFDTLAASFEKHGYKMPKLIFWNVNSRTNTIPVRDNDLGVALVSGFSVNTLKMVMSEKLDPWEILIEQLTTERYEPILKAMLN